jgi:hypothetical protein
MMILKSLSVEKDGDDGLIVAFSDGTTGAVCSGGVANAETLSTTRRKAKEPESSANPNNALIGHHSVCRLIATVSYGKAEHDKLT